MATREPIPPYQRLRAGADRVATAILDAAADVLATRGEAASMGDVAAAAGVGRSTLYRYFPSREALLAALAETALREAGERLRLARLDAVPVDEAIARLARAFVAVGNRYVVLIREGIPIEDKTLVRECREPVQALFARGQAERQLRDDLSVEWLEKFFVGALLAGLTLGAEQGLGTEEIAAKIADLFLDGARRRPAKD